MATLTFTTKFDLVSSPKKLILTDISNWVGQGILTSDVVGNMKITSPSGAVIHNNTNYGNTPNILCDIDINVSTTNQIVIQLPIDSSTGLPEIGVYTIVYTVYDKNLLTYSTLTNTYTNAYVRPVVSIQQTVDCISPLFTSKDITNYVVNGITPVATGTNTVDYPYGSAGEATPTIGVYGTPTSTSTFYQGTQTTEIASSLTYTFTDGLIVLDAISGTLEVVVDCKDVCSIYCCIRSIEQQMMEKKGVDDVKYREFKDLFDTIMGFVSLSLLAIRCGKTTDVNGYLSELRTLSNCTADCGCTGTTPSQVTGLGGLVNQVIVSGSASITVTPVTIGNTTTYTVTLNATLSALLSSLYNTEVVAGNNIIVYSNLVGNTKTFTVNGSDTIIESTDSSISAPLAYQTSGVLIVGTYYTIANYTGGDNFINVGGTNVTGNVFKATGTTPTSWVNNSSLNVTGTKTYNLSKNLNVLRTSVDYNTPYPVTIANNQTVPNAVYTAPVSGMYLIIYEADAIFTGTVGASAIVYRLYNFSTSVAISDDRVAMITDIVAAAGTPLVTEKLFCTAICTLTAGDQVCLKVDSAVVNNTITGRSIVGIKIN